MHKLLIPTLKKTMAEALTCLLISTSDTKGYILKSVCVNKLR